MSGIPGAKVNIDLYDVNGASTSMKPLLTAKEVAEVLKLSERTIFSLTKSGKLAVIRTGSSVRYAPEDVQAFVEAHRLREQSSSGSLVVAY